MSSSHAYGSLYNHCRNSQNRISLLLLDFRLVKIFLLIPSEENCGSHGMGCYPHRRALQDVVPNKIAWKYSKDMGHLTESNHIFQASNLKGNKLEDLHPALNALLNAEKYKNQIQRYQKMDTSVDITLVILLLRRLKTVWQLNGWIGIKISV